MDICTAAASINKICSKESERASERERASEKSEEEKFHFSLVFVLYLYVLPFATVFCVFRSVWIMIYKSNDVAKF